MKICVENGRLKISLGITQLHEILGLDYGIEEPYWGPQLPVTNPNTKNINGKYSIWPNDCLSDVRASRTKTLLNVPPPTSLEQSIKKIFHSFLKMKLEQRKKSC